MELQLSFPTPEMHLRNPELVSCLSAPSFPFADRLWWKTEITSLPEYAVRRRRGARERIFFKVSVTSMLEKKFERGENT